MHHTKHPNPQSLSYSKRSQIMKKLTTLLLCISIFSFMISHSSWFCLFLYSFNFHFSSFPSQLLDRNCIFLICTGILIFLAKNSGLVSSSLSCHGDLDDEFLKKNGLELEFPDEKVLQEKELHRNVVLFDGGKQTNHLMRSGKLVAEKSHGEVALYEDGNQAEGLMRSGKLVGEKSHGEVDVYGDGKQTEGFMENGELGAERSGLFVKGCLVVEDEAKQEEMLEKSDFSEEEEEEEGSVEELNKRSDDFIRRVKEKIRIEAQQHMVMAH